MRAKWCSRKPVNKACDGNARISQLALFSRPSDRQREYSADWSGVEAISYNYRAKVDRYRPTVYNDGNTMAREMGNGRRHGADGLADDNIPARTIALRSMPL